MPINNRRKCSKCLKYRPLDDFKLVNGKPHGYCGPCGREYYKTYNANRYKSEESRAEELERRREKYHRLVKPMRMKRKQELVEKLGGKCNRCGYNKSAAALDFHHKDPTEKMRTISHLLAVNTPESFIDAIEEAARCELLCSNCHREETYPGFTISEMPINAPSS